MGYRELSSNMPPGYQEGDLREAITKELGIEAFSSQIAHKSLDARKKSNIHWQIRVSVLSEELTGGEPVAVTALEIPSRVRDERAVVVGSGPAGFFAALVLQKAGFPTTLVERGAEVRKRARGIRSFQTTGLFDPVSDNLKAIVANLRKEFLDLGGRLLSETLLEDIKVEGGRVVEAFTASGGIEADYCIIAPGHSAYETYRMLISRGVGFRAKSFALGSRVEHPQRLINRAQWGREDLPGVKAAEYRLASRGAQGLQPEDKGV
jgi:hypothetical protein